MRAAAGTARYWAPLVAGFACLVGVLFAGPLLAWVLLIVAFGLIFDGATAMWARAGSVGGLTNHRQ